MEKRKHPRYTLQENVIAVCENHPGRIRNLSLGGVSLVYLNLNGISSKEIGLVDIFDGDNDFYMAGIPCQQREDQLILNESPFAMTTMTQKSLSFSELTPNQNTLLKNYLEQHAILGD